MRGTRRSRRRFPMEMWGLPTMGALRNATETRPVGSGRLRPQLATSMHRLETDVTARTRLLAAGVVLLGGFGVLLVTTDSRRDTKQTEDTTPAEVDVPPAGSPHEPALRASAEYGRLDAAGTSKRPEARADAPAIPQAAPGDEEQFEDASAGRRPYSPERDRALQMIRLVLKSRTASPRIGAARLQVLYD